MRGRVRAVSIVTSISGFMSAIPDRPIALLSPLVEERDALFHRLTDVETRAIGILQVATGKLEGHSVALAESGVGKVASAAIATLIATSLEDRKSTRLNSSHLVTSYAVFCLRKKN